MTKSESQPGWESGNEQSLEPLVAALADRDSVVRARAIKAIGELGDTRGVEPLVSALRHHDPGVRSEAVLALERLGDTRAVEPLITVLGKDSDAAVRGVAARALGQLGDARAAQALVTALKKAARASSLSAYGKGHLEDREVGEAAWEAAKMLGPSVMLEPLRAALSRAEQYDLRQALSRYVNAISEPDAGPSAEPDGGG